MKYENGIYTIPCKVNGVPMKFIFDTGASDVSISLTEAKFLIKQGLLSDNDIKGKVRYKIANGDIEVGTKINLKEISIDGFILKNVEASIVNQLNAPLLLGQSAISKLGSFQVDGNKLIIRENKNKYYNFLNIDLTKTYSDFGFLQEAIEQFATNGFVPVEMSRISKNKHFLSHLALSESVVFDLKGKISFIILSDKFENLKGFQKEKTAKEKFANLVDELKEKYGKSNSSSERVFEWKSLHFDILTSINANNEIMLMYMPKVSYLNPVSNFKHGTTEIKKDKPKKTISKEYKKETVISSRKLLISMIKYLLSYLNQGIFNEDTFKGGVYDTDGFTETTFPRIEDDNLIIYIEREYKEISLSSNREKILKLENSLVKHFCLNAFSLFITGEPSIDDINKSELNNIIFVYDVTYADGNSRSVVKKIKLKRKRLNLEFPFTKGEFFKLLK